MSGKGGERGTETRETRQQGFGGGKERLYLFLFSSFVSLFADSDSDSVTGSYPRYVSAVRALIIRLYVYGCMVLLPYVFIVETYKPPPWRAMINQYSLQNERTSYNITLRVVTLDDVRRKVRLMTRSSLWSPILVQAGTQRPGILAFDAIRNYFPGG